MDNTRLLSFFTLVLAAGCGGGEDFEMAVIRGKVTCNGELVPGGTLSFAPLGEDEGGTNIVGRGTLASIKPDGTYETQAVVGRLRIGFAKPDVADLEEEAAGGGEDADAAKKLLEAAKKLVDLPCNRPSEEEFQVVAGENTIDIELIHVDPREFD
jgi:hypothetical protein